MHTLIITFSIQNHSADCIGYTVDAIWVLRMNEAASHKRDDDYVFWSKIIAATAGSSWRD